MTLIVYHSDRTADNYSSAQNPPLSFSRRPFHPLLARRDSDSTQQLWKPVARLRKPRVHGIGGE